MGPCSTKGVTGHRPPPRGGARLPKPSIAHLDCIESSFLPHAACRSMVAPTPSQDAALEPVNEVIVLGGGPAGLAAAVLLARDHGVAVTLYEKASDLSQSDEEAGLVGACDEVWAGAGRWRDTTKSYGNLSTAWRAR